MILLQYVAKLFICSGLLVLYYWLFLRNKQFHRYNRFYLLATVLVSLVFPFINIPLFVSNTPSETPVFIQAIQTVTTITAFKHSFSLTELFNWQNTVLFIYVTGIAILLVALIKSLLYIRRIRQQYTAEKLDDLTLYNTNEQGTPFSFFKSIFWNRQISFHSKEGQQIFRHELFHIRQQHSLDNLFIEIVTCIAWFNPLFYLIKKELKAIHEFLADQYAISSSDRYAYAELLIMASIHTKQQSLTHPFFNTQLKRRIAMITQFKNKKYGYWSRVMALPVAILLFCSFVITIKTKLQNKEENPYKEVQQSLIKNISYPAKALAENKQGEVIVSFVIAENGSISNTTLLTEDDFGMGEEVLSSLQKIPLDKLANLKRNRSGAHVLKTTYILEANDTKIPYVNDVRTRNGYASEKTVIDFEIVVTAYAKNKIIAESRDEHFVRSLKITDTVEVTEKSETLLAYLKENQEKLVLLSVNNTNGVEKIYMLTLNDHKTYKLNDKLFSLLKKENSQKDTIRLSPGEFEKKFNYLLSKKVTFSTSTVSPMIYLYQKEDPTVYTITLEEFNALKEKNKAFKEEQQDEKLFSKVEVEAQYPGGDPAWKKFLFKNFVYPQKAIDQEIQGIVILQFIVEKNGELSDINSISGHPLLADEAIRIIKLSGKWNPALQNGRTVRAYKKQPIKFVLELQSETKDAPPPKPQLKKPGEMLLVVDGIEKGKVKDAKATDKWYPKEKLGSMKVITGKAATDKYGEKGKNGVVEVILKKKAVK